ncbi:MAG TPA: fumarylacetoacetate hydrolase family protein [Pseudonocardia sp.]|jgi:2-keto-4-pentenoate hydratase/2-oxohepta-3-ene-1,7-dioic acid hydratase in catechol pathway|nr:fumarylacetoacetate hydrolase family protein [Pseudonocardia sp.]
MLLVTFSDPADDTTGPRPGVLRDGTVLDLGTGYGSLLDIVAAGPTVLTLLAERLTAGAPALPLDTVRLHAPLRPGKIVGVGLNYVEHVEESSRTLDTAKDLPTRPVLFSKPATAVVGPGEPIQHNGDMTAQLDWECELAVVIGRTARRVSVEDALGHVFGYSIVNDISARDQRRSGQWFFSKGQDSYAPLGPAIRTADEVPDPQRLDLGLKVNGEVKQKGNTAHMLFSVATLIADISSGMTLEPGDVIATGSPQGVGAAQTPPQFLTPGDVVEATIEGIGTLRNPVVDAR